MKAFKLIAILALLLWATPVMAIDNFCCERILKLNEKDVPIDCGIAELVKVLNDGGIKTISSCDGHGEDGYVLTEKYLLIISKERGKKEAFKRYKDQFDVTAQVNQIRREIECRE